MDKISEVRIEEVKDYEENRHFWRIYYTKNERIIILGESRVKPQLTRVVAVYKWKKTKIKKANLIVDLKYYEGMPVIKEIKRVSKPGRRVYSRATSIPRIQNGLGLAIISTNKGVMSDIEARKNNIGGEIICRVF